MYFGESDSGLTDSRRLQDIYNCKFLLINNYEAKISHSGFSQLEKL
jgi:hypothetical protein